MAGPVKSGDRTDGLWLIFNRLQEIEHRIMARNEVVSLSSRYYGGNRKFDVDSSGVQEFKFVSAEDDYIVCHTWDGTTEGTDPINIAKQPELRCSLTSETILGTLHSYTYSADPGGDPDNPIRHDDDGVSPEDQRVVPPWAPGQVIYAISAETGVNDLSSNPIGLLEMSNSREWAALESDLSVIDGGGP